MNRLRVFVLACAAALLPLAAVRAEEGPPKPGPEHEKLKALEGVWEAVVKSEHGDSKATATYKMELGGMWLVSNFEGEFGGQKFSGKGLDTYNASKKKYVSVWVDSMMQSPMLLEGTYDKDGKVLTMTGEGPGEDGKPMKVKSTSEMPDKESMVFKMYQVDKDGKDKEMMTITYKRKK
jgi:hypothetical protein